MDSIYKFHTGNGLHFTFNSYRKAGGVAKDDRPYKKVAMKGMMIKYTHLSIYHQNKIQIVFFEYYILCNGIQSIRYFLSTKFVTK